MGSSAGRETAADPQGIYKLFSTVGRKKIAALLVFGDISKMKKKDRNLSR